MKHYFPEAIFFNGISEWNWQVLNPRKNNNKIIELSISTDIDHSERVK